MTVTDGSVAVRRLRRAGTTLAAAAADSRAVGDVRTVVTHFGIAAGRSRSRRGLGRLGTTFGRWLRGSWVYGWLAAEPDPDVIVVDLRETYTVGPILALLDRAADQVAPRWRNSRPRRLIASAGAVAIDAPVRVAGWIAVVGLLASLAVTLVRGGTPGGPGLLALGLALLATRERRSAARLRETWAGRAVTALCVPPEPPAEREENGR